jgi:hypothetical protein
MYIGTRHGDFYIFSAAGEKKLLAMIEMGAPISSTAAAANGRLYISTMTDLFALKL